MSAITLNSVTGPVQGSVKLPLSKSIYNRLLILSALSEGKIRIAQAADSDDTKILQELINSNSSELNVGHAGTAMRFLAAYCCTLRREVTLTGSERMKERPIGPLVDALNSIGFKISYQNKTGFPPLIISDLNQVNETASLKIKGNISSQFISALLLIAPVFEQFKIEILGEIYSRPYIEMTIQLLKLSGHNVLWKGQIISVNKGVWKANGIHVERDWSAAVFWYSYVGLRQNGNLLLKGISRESIQGDSRVLEMMSQLGVRSEITSEGIRIHPEELNIKEVSLDFKNCPDLAQAIIVYCAAQNIEAKITGIESLRIKETDRIKALQNELKKFGKSFVEKGDGIFQLVGKFQAHAAIIDTYGDHRMAMAFAPLAALCPTLTINDPEVVSKSYPGFWEAFTQIHG